MLTSSPARERLLRSASATFYAEGIRGVGVDRIVTEAGVTRATFYRHFPGKDDLVVAYLEAVEAAARAAFADVPDDPAAAAQLVRDLVGAMGGQLCRPGFRGCPFINAAAEFADPAHPVHRAVLRHRAWLRGTVERALAAAGHPDPVGGALLVMMLRDGAMVAGYLADPDATRAALVAAVDDLLDAAGRPAAR